MIVTSHDQTRFTNLVCINCQTVLHIHQPQAESVLQDQLAYTVCKNCHTPLLLPTRSDVLALILDTFLSGDTSPFPLLPLPAHTCGRNQEQP
jgi:RNase P subunit RPR2